MSRACAGRWTLSRTSRSQRRKGAACGAAPPCPWGPCPFPSSPFPGTARRALPSGPARVTGGNVPEGEREDAAAPEHRTGGYMQRILWTLTFLLLTAVTCPAGQHPVRVTRTAGDFYAVFDQDLLIKTAFCSVRAFEERAALRAGELVFADGTRCTVDRVYARQRLRRGPTTSPSPGKRRASTVWRTRRRCFSRRAAVHWPCGTRPCWRCRTAFPVRCACTAAPAGSRASSNPFRTESRRARACPSPPADGTGAGRPPGAECPPCQTAGGAVAAGGCTEKRPPQTCAATAFPLSGTRSRA